VTPQPTAALRRRLLAGALGLALAGGTCAAVLLVHGPTQGRENAGQPGVTPHLVPDVGGLSSGSQSTSSAPRVVAVNPNVELIPSAGGPVRAYGGAPGGATFVPVHGER
jgi:hypothetical protein